MIVCLCRGLSERDVRSLVETGAMTALDVANACGAGADCGACERIVERLIDDARYRADAEAGMARSGMAQ